jgi:nucleotide-binding universal stress UspA family protein
VRAEVKALAPTPSALNLQADAWKRNAFTRADWQTYTARHNIDMVVLTPPSERSRGPLLAMPGIEPMVMDTDAAMLMLPWQIPSASFTHVLAPTDLSETAVPTLHHAEAIADFLGARLDVLHVLTRRQYVALTPTDLLALDDAAATPRVAARRLRTWYQRHTHPVYTQSKATELRVEQGDAVSTITQVARAQQTDLIVLAAGHHDERQQPLSTLTENVLRRTTCPVLVARPGTHSLLSASVRSASPRAALP